MTATRDARFPLVDAMRAIAALSIVVFHLPFWFRMAADDPLKPYALQLNVGVTIFFLISGFLLYRPFAEARHGSGGQAAPATGPYALRRIARIGPAYWVALPIVVLMLGPSGEAATATPVFSLRGVVPYFGFLQVYDANTLLGGISAAWTLCVEAAFYAFLPLWAWLIRRAPARHALRAEVAGLLLLAAVGLLWSAIAASNQRITAAVFTDVTQIKPWLYVLPAYLDHFAIGMALAVVSVRRASFPRLDRAPWAPWVLAAAAFLLLGRVDRTFDGFGAQFLATHVLQAVVAFGLLLPAVLGDPGRGGLRRALALRPLAWLGIVSYGIYLWHAALIQGGVRLGLDGDLGAVLFTALVLVATVAAGAASFYVVERPALRFARRRSPGRHPDADVRMRALEHEPSGVPPG